MKFKYGVFGTGRMGQAAAFHLATRPETEKVTLFDINGHVKRTAELLQANPDVKCQIEPVLGSFEQLENHHDLDAIVATCGYPRYVKLVKECISRRIHMVDLGGNRNVVVEQFKLHDDAVKAGVKIVPDQGIAPGTINILGMHAYKALEAQGCTDIDIILRVGGLPVAPSPDNPMQYEITWSADGLINEYVIPSDVIVDGAKAVSPALTELEEFKFPNPYVTSDFEAFVTGGGSSNLPDLLEGKVRNLNYKTIRYKGHYNVVKSLELLGLFHEARATMTDLFEKNLKSKSFDDIILARAGGRGKKPEGGAINVGTDIVCVQDTVTGFSSMAQCTGYSAAIIASMLADNTVSDVGVLKGEAVVDGRELISRLEKTDISIGPLGTLK